MNVYMEYRANKQRYTTWMLNSYTYIPISISIYGKRPNDTHFYAYMYSHRFLVDWRMDDHVLKAYADICRECVNIIIIQRNIFS